MQIVIVEDEAIVSLFIRRIAQNLGHTICAALTTARETLDFVHRMPVDLVFMDINIDGPADGIQLARKLTALGETSIAYVSAYDDGETLENAIDAHTVGFFSKPLKESDIHIALLLAAHRTYVRHTSISRTIRFGDTYRFICEENLLETTGGTIELTRQELNVLKILMKSPDRTVDSETIAQTLYREEHADTAAVRNLVHRLRRKLPEAIETVPGYGYRLVRLQICD